MKYLRMELLVPLTESEYSAWNELFEDKNMDLPMEQWIPMHKNVIIPVLARATIDNVMDTDIEETKYVSVE